MATLRTARAYGVPPWELEAAADRDPRALRWALLADTISEYEAAMAAKRRP